MQTKKGRSWLRRVRWASLPHKMEGRTSKQGPRFHVPTNRPQACCTSAAHCATHSAVLEPRRRSRNDSNANREWYAVLACHRNSHHGVKPYGCRGSHDKSGMSTKRVACDKLCIAQAVAASMFNKNCAARFGAGRPRRRTPARCVQGAVPAGNPSAPRSLAHLAFHSPRTRRFSVSNLFLAAGTGRRTGGNRTENRATHAKPPRSRPTYFLTILRHLFWVTKIGKTNNQKIVKNRLHYFLAIF